MIHTLSGTVKEIAENCITVDMGSIGFGVSVARTADFALEQKVTLLVHMHWNQENGPSLFGFATALEKSVFLLITSCSGIGPKIALAILAQLGATSFLEAIQSGNDKALSQVNGIGTKKAEQIIVQLKHKVAKLIESGIPLGTSQALEERNDVMQALKSLNYSRQEISSAMHYLNEHYSGSAVAFDQLLRQALAYLAKQA